MRLIRDDGTEIDLAAHGLKYLTHHAAALSLSHDTEKLDGVDGEILLSSSYNARPITVEMAAKSFDWKDMYLLKNETNRLFATKEPFYIVLPGDPGKRWRVTLNRQIDWESLTQRLNKVSVEFITRSPFAESVGTTLDQLTYDAEIWQYGQGLIRTDASDKPKYTHSVSTFDIFNAGDVPVDPRRFPLKIVYRGTSNNLVIKNTTTGDEWKYNGSTVSTDQLILNGIRSFKNATSIFKNTNKKLITLAPGWNTFQLSGASGSFLISFDHRFYYL